MNPTLEEAIQLRKDNRPEEALKLLAGLLRQSPGDPQTNYQIAWTFDSMGRESEAVPCYERALEGGLLREDLRGALLGLGSTLRCLGRYEQSLAILDRGVAEFPDDRSMVVFRALTRFSLGRYHESTGNLLTQLLDTTSDRRIKAYERALRFYADKLDQTWT